MLRQVFCSHNDRSSDSRSSVMANEHASLLEVDGASYAAGDLTDTVANE